jgi:hypothetical protein
MNDSELASLQMFLMLLTERVTVLEQLVIDNSQPSAADAIKKARAYSQQNGVTQGAVTNNGFVSLNKAGAMGEPQRTGVIGPDSNAQTIMSYKKFIEGLLEIEVHGLHVTEEVRNAARKVLGR